MLTDAQAATLEPLRQGTVAAETALNAFDGTASADIVISWSFTTQSTTDELVATRAQNRTIVPVSGFATPSGGAVASSGGAANINVGTLQVPYYLTASSVATSPSNDPTALASCWEGAGAGGLGNCAAGPHVTKLNPAPVVKSTQTIPLLVSIPKATPTCAMPGTGWPVAIFVHGITGNRTDMLKVADSMAEVCMAVVAIDLPMHGITDGTQTFKNSAANGGERTFDLDLLTQDANGNTIAAGPDGNIDSSGAHFVNLANLLNTRDNLRQGASDLYTLVYAIEQGAVTDGVNIMDPAKIYFYGHSLGTIIGTTFLATEPNVRDAVIGMGGVSAVKILDGSFNRGPTLIAGLGANGVVKGTSDYEKFLGAAQTVIDSGDSVNFSTAAATGRGVLFFEIVGGNGSPSDLTVPNTVPDGNDTTATVPAPLAGTEPQLALMGLTHVNASVGPGAADLKVVTKFVVGNHESLLSSADTTNPASVPGDNAKVTTEMQTQAANFLASDGLFLKVTDDTLLQAPAAP